MTRGEDAERHVEDRLRAALLLYVGLTRATTHLIAIAPPALARRLRG